MKSSLQAIFPDTQRGGAVAALVRELRRFIEKNGLQTGDSLPTEREMCERFKVARNTVREAIGVLRAYGVVDVRPKIGAVIVNRHMEAARDLFSFQFQISEESFHDIQGFRALIEVEACDTIIDRATDDDLAVLHRLNDLQLEDAPVADLARADFDFHTRLLSITENKTIQDVYRILEPTIFRAMELGKASEGRADTHAYHAGILGAIEARDRIGYRYRMREHLERGLAYIVKASSAPDGVESPSIHKTKAG